MGKRALIAEPDHEEALRQAAILQEDGYEASVFSGQDLVAEVQASLPDVLILRQERPGQTGLALVPRIKSVAAGTAIVVTTTELTSEAIEKNKRQKVHADSFLRIPADRTELLAAAHSLPQVQEVADAEAEVEAPAAGAGDQKRRPPPLPPSGLRGLTQARQAPRTGGEAVLSAEDITFVEKVFSTIQHVDTEQSDAAAQQESRLDGGDRKVMLLRTELKRRERELAKLSRLWKAREEDLRQKEARVEQKDIELEGLRLRIQELSAELDKAHATLVEKETEFGKAIGETYDNQALQQAELIQQVAQKENEVNSLRTKLRKAEDGFAAERKAFTERVFEWEKAYADFEQHHWKVMEASVEEVARLENAIGVREKERRAVQEALKDRESRIVHLKRTLDARTAELRAVEVEHGKFEDRAVAVAQSYVLHERVARIQAEDDARELQARLADVEEDLFRQRRLLGNLEKQRQRDISRVATVARAQDADRMRLAAEREAFRARAEELASKLEEAKALGEATAAFLFALEEKRRIVGEAQIRVRDERLADLFEETTRLSTNLADVTERLSASEMEHTAEHARAEELETALLQTREQAAENEHNLAVDLEKKTAERDKLADSLEKTELALASTRENLAQEKDSRKQREMEVAGILERKENEAAARNEKIVELERSFGDAKEDIQNLRKTVGLRDERITELLNRVRQADEQQVALEGQVYRLTTSGTEKDAELTARAERLEQLAQKLAQREDTIEKLDAAHKQALSLAADKQAHIERQEQNVAALHAEIGRAREDGARLKGELDARSQQLFESERQASQLTQELANAREEIQTGEVLAEQLQSQVRSLDARGQEMRALLNDTDGKLRVSLGDLEAAGQRADQLKVELAELRERTLTHEREIAGLRNNLAELTRERDGLSQQGAQLSAQFNETESERQALEEQLAAQVRENAEMNAAFSDASQRLEEAAQRQRALEDAVAKGEGRISAQDKVIKQAEAQLTQRAQELADKNEELAELRDKVAEAKSAIDERAKWLATREQTIAELKGQLEIERKAREEAGNAGAAGQQQLAAMKKAYDELRARLEERERLLQAQSAHAQQEIERESARADRVGADLREATARIEAMTTENNALRAEAGKGAETGAALEKLRGDALKLRQIAEKAANDAKAGRILLEKADAQRKQAEAEAQKARAELDDIRTASRQADAFVAQARLEAEQRLGRLRELEAQNQRLTAARDAAERAKAEAEADAQRARAEAATGAQAGSQALGDEVQRLMAEVGAAKKQTADALAALRQAKAENEQIKRLAAEKIRQAQAQAAGAKGGLAPPRAPTPMPTNASAPPTGAPAAASRAPAPAPPPPAGLGGLAPPAGVVPAPGAMPATPKTGGTIPAMPSMPSMPPMPPVSPQDGAPDDPFAEGKTVLVDKMHIPSAARGDKG